MMRKLFLHIDVPHELTLLANQFVVNGYDLYLVGGAVRDALLGSVPKDFDVATNAEPDKVIELVSNFAGVKILEIGKSFGIVKVVFPSGLEFEIATFRVDIGSGRRPDAVVFSTIEEDVKRRDLTINALFWDIYTHAVVDLVGGIDDLENKVVRTVGNPNDRFGEDRLRVLRAVRFAAQLGCELHPDTEQAIIHNPSLSGVSAERIRDEFIKGLDKARSVTHFLVMLDRLGLFPHVFPGLDVDRSRFREVRDVGVLLALLINQGSFAVLSPSIRSVGDVLNRLKYTADEVRQYEFLQRIRFADFVQLTDVEPKVSILKLHRAFESSKLTERQVRTFAGLSRSLTEDYLNAFFRYSPSVDATALMAEGFKGKALGVELERRESIEFSRLLSCQQNSTAT